MINRSRRGSVYAFDWFLTELSGRCPGTEILIIAGNHDSPERLAYGASFLARHRIHIAALPPADRTEYLKQVTLTDEWGPVHFIWYRLSVRVMCAICLTPMVIPMHSRNSWRGETIRKQERNVVLAHQFFVWNGQNPETCDSERRRC